MTRTVLIVLGVLFVAGAVVGFVVMRMRSSSTSSAVKGSSAAEIDPVTGAPWQTVAQASASA